MAECLIEHTRNMLFIVVAGKTPSNHMTSDEVEFYNSLKPYSDKGRIYALFQIFQKIRNFQRSNYLQDKQLQALKQLTKDKTPLLHNSCNPRIDHLLQYKSYRCRNTYRHYTTPEVFCK